jgi:hypothetical protein
MRKEFIGWHTSLSHHLDFVLASRILDKNPVPLGRHRQLDLPTTVRDCVALCEYPSNANELLQQGPESHGDDEELATGSPCSSVQALIALLGMMAGPSFAHDRAERLQAGRTFPVFAYYSHQGCAAAFHDLPAPSGRTEVSIWYSSLYSG